MAITVKEYREMIELAKKNKLEDLLAKFSLRTRIINDEATLDSILGREIDYEIINHIKHG